MKIAGKFDWVLWIFCSFLFIISTILNFTLNPYLQIVCKNDFRYWLPYKNNTVQYSLVLSIGFFVYLPFVFFLELAISLGWNKLTRSKAIICSVNMIGGLLCSFSIVYFVTETTKLIVGGIRPNFLSTCFPGIPSSYDNQCIVSNSQCSLSNVKLRDRKSFFSGHTSSAAALSVYLSLQLIWHSIYTFGSKNSVASNILFSLSFIPIYISWLVGLSRIRDHKHHHVDVATGFFFAVILTVPVFLFVQRSSNLNLLIRSEMPIE